MNVLGWVGVMRYDRCNDVLYDDVLYGVHRTVAMTYNVMEGHRHSSMTKGACLLMLSRRLWKTCSRLML